MAECFTISTDCAMNPYECDGDSELVSLLGFFQIEAPCISSFKSYKLDQAKYSKVLYKMIGSKEFLFINPQARTDKRLISFNMCDAKIKCVGIRGLLKKQNKDENELVCLLRHIRNSVAHGRVFTRAVGGVMYILFDDTRPDGAFSARIVVTKNLLKSWKKIILANTR